jgi:hypothetical protein
MEINEDLIPSHFLAARESNTGRLETQAGRARNLLGMNEIETKVDHHW